VKQHLRVAYTQCAIFLIIFLMGEGSLPFATAQSSAKLSLFESSKAKKIEAYLKASEEELGKNPQLAAQKLAKVWPLIQDTKVSSYKGRYYHLQSKLALHNLDPKAAINYFFAALQAFQKQRDRLTESHIYLHLGHIFQQQLNFQKAIDYYEFGLNILKSFPRQTFPLRVQFHIQLGICNLAMKRFEEARSQLELGRQLASKASLNTDLCMILHRIGQIDHAQGRLSFAQDIYMQAYQQARQRRLPALEIKIANDLCRLNLALGQAEEARKYAFAKKRLAGELRRAHCINLSHYLIAQTFLIEKKLDSAFTYNKLALDKADSARDTLMRDLWTQRGAILSQQNQTLDAINALEKAEYWEEKILSSSEKLKIERQQHELTVQSIEKKLHQDFAQYFRQERWIRFSMFFAVLFVAALSFYFLLKLNIRQKANRQLQVQNTEIEAQKNQLEQLSQVKDQLFAVISHDLRSPLWAIHEVLDTLDEPDITPADRTRWLDLLRQQTAKTSVLLENLLYWAKIQMNSYQAAPEEIHLSPIVEDLKETLQLIFADKVILIENQVSPDFTLRQDSGMIRMALRNLLTNAVKFSHAGQTVQVRAERNKEWVDIVIQDQGLGMSAEQLEKALRGQLSRFGTKGEVGSGIGLSLVRQFIESNGGKLSGQAAINQGCTFTISLPSCRKVE
jgi:signal transduction histidine kinase